MKRSDILKIVFGLGCFCLSSFVVANSEQHTTEVACRYEMKTIPHGKAKLRVENHDWFFWRKPGMIQTQDADGDYGEIWERTGNGTIQYRKLYVGDKTAVEYMPADMPSNDMSFDWLKLSSMISQEELDTLKLVKKMQVFGRAAELRKGKIDGQNIELLWLVDEKLPAKIVREDKSGRVELRLAEIAPLSEARRQPLDLEAISNYRHIDAVDFGDMENDPFVKKVMAAEGHHHH